MAFDFNCQLRDSDWDFAQDISSDALPGEKGGILLGVTVSWPRKSGSKPTFLTSRLWNATVSLNSHYLEVRKAGLPPLFEALD